MFLHCSAVLNLAYAVTEADLGIDEQGPYKRTRKCPPRGCLGFVDMSLCCVGILFCKLRHEVSCVLTSACTMLLSAARALLLWEIRPIQRFPGSLVDWGGQVRKEKKKVEKWESRWTREWSGYFVACKNGEALVAVLN